MKQQCNIVQEIDSTAKKQKGTGCGYQDIKGFQAIGSTGHLLFHHRLIVVIKGPVATRDSFDAVQVNVDFHVNALEILSIGNLRKKVLKNKL